MCQKKFCICIEVIKTYEGNDYNEIFEVLSKLKNEKLKINKVLIEKYKDLLENPDFEQDNNPKTALGIYKFEHDNNRLLEW